MMPFAPHRRVRVGEAEAPRPVHFIPVRPDEVLVPGEEFLVVVRSPRGAAAELLRAVQDLGGVASALLSGGPRVADDRTVGAQAFMAVIATGSYQLVDALRAAGAPGDEWGIYRADYAEVLARLPEIAELAASRAGHGMVALQAWFAEMAAEWGARVASSAGRGLGTGTIALALGAAAGGLLLYAWARGK